MIAHKYITMITLNVLRNPVDQTWSIERIATEAPPRTWEDVFVDAKAELHDVSTVLDNQERQYGQYYPLKQDIFNAFNYTPLPNVKVVIIGQDPYHQTISVNGQTLPRAVGLSFSVRQEDNIPSSLQNIYTELENTVRGFRRPDHGDLREWARQGVLLLNTCLTVRPGQPGSHGDIWHGFVKKVFKAISVVNPYCVYMLWGRDAQKLRPMLGERSVVLEAAHPSGLSARRGFFGSNHFNLANDALIKQGKVGINWRISTLAELKSPSTNQTRTLSPAITDHRPQLAPVNVTALPMIVPIKQTSPSEPMTTQIPGVKVQGHTIIPMALMQGASQGLPIMPGPTLPTIPHTKPIGSSTPMIPKIQFGTTVSQNDVRDTGVPQILTLQATVATPAPIQGLPKIPTIIQ